jgi:drug/metabolite transporter (DMT)-like permease
MNDRPFPGPSAAPANPDWSRLGIALAPGLFVFLWSTGFIGTKLGLSYTEPFTFLAARFAITAAVLAAVAFLFGAPWPATPAQWMHSAVAGLLIQGAYLGGVFWAIGAGLSAGVTALIVSLQPLLTGAAAGPVLKEKVSARQWLGLALGFGGVVLVLSDKVSLSGASVPAVAAAVIALGGITLGTLYQKRHGGGADLRSGNAIQFGASAVLTGILAVLFESLRIEWTVPFLLALGWLIVVLSFGAITLLYILIRRGAAARVASLFYLVPPVTALMAYAMFDETLGLLALVGMIVTVAGVALAMKSG